MEERRIFTMRVALAESENVMLERGLFIIIVRWFDIRNNCNLSEDKS